MITVLYLLKKTLSFQCIKVTLTLKEHVSSYLFNKRLIINCKQEIIQRPFIVNNILNLKHDKYTGQTRSSKLYVAICIYIFNVLVIFRMAKCVLYKCGFFFGTDILLHSCYGPKQKQDTFQNVLNKCVIMHQYYFQILLQIIK